MQVDILEFKNFYQTILGAYVKKSVKRILKDFDAISDTRLILGYGYVTPYLGKKSFSFMPAAQGVMRWPSKENRTTLVYENALPLADDSLDTIIVVHGFEFCHFPNDFLKECWRVLKSEGRLIMIVPNRRSIWAHRDITPLGHGQPYTMTQLMKLLKKNKFLTKEKNRALYKLPFTSYFGRLVNLLLKKIGPHVATKLSGLIAVEAVKEVYHPKMIGVSSRQSVRGDFVPAHSVIHQEDLF